MLALNACCTFIHLYKRLHYHWKFSWLANNFILVHIKTYLLPTWSKPRKRPVYVHTMMVKLSTKKERNESQTFFLQITFSSVSNEFPLYNVTNEQREETACRAVSAFLLLLIILVLIKPTTNPKNYNDTKYVMEKAGILVLHLQLWGVWPPFLLLLLLPQRRKKPLSHLSGFAVIFFTVFLFTVNKKCCILIAPRWYFP